MNKKNELMFKEQNPLTELKNTQELCSQLMKTPHYAKMGLEGIFAIVTTANTLGVNPIQALNGDLYFVKGRVEMSSRMMGALIRSRGHSLTTSKLDNKQCVIHGKRIDSGDSMSASFSIEEAQKANLLRGPWITYPSDMLYARALSRLARRLFPDIIGNCYVEGEIKYDSNISNQNDNQIEVIEDKKQLRTEEEIKDLINAFQEIPEYRKEIEEFLEKKDIHGFGYMPKSMYDKVLKIARQKSFSSLQESLKEQPDGEFYNNAYFSNSYFSEEVQNA